MEFSFAGRVAVVTGAAHGIGRAICVELSRRGAHVWAGDILPEELAATRPATTWAGAARRSRSM